MTFIGPLLQIIVMSVVRMEDDKAAENDQNYVQSKQIATHTPNNWHYCLWLTITSYVGDIWSLSEPDRL